jgi:hypothetical protein
MRDFSEASSNRISLKIEWWKVSVTEKADERWSSSDQIKFE